MTDREKLTDDERFALTNHVYALGPKVLRIIDRDEADRAALVKELEEARAVVARLVKKDHESANQYQAYMVWADEEADELRAELQKERNRRVEHRQMNQSLNEQVQRLEAEVARLTALDKGLRIELSSRDAEVARLTEALEESEKLAAGNAEIAAMRLRRAKAAEQKLAAAEYETETLQMGMRAVEGQRDSAEARVRELEVDRDEERALARDAESELAQLRTENADIVRLNALAARRTHEAESELAQLRARVEEFRSEGLSALCHRMPESTCEDIDSALYDILNGQEVLRGPK